MRSTMANGRERLQHINVTLSGEHTANQREWQVWWSRISASGEDRHMPVSRQHPNTWQQRKNTTDACLMLAGSTILSSTSICPRCDLIFTDTAEFQRYRGSTEYPPPEGRASVINVETSDSASGGNLWQKVRDRWRARRTEREAKASQTAAERIEGRRDDGEVRARGRRGTPRADSQTRSCTMPSSRLSAPYLNKYGKSEAQSSCAG